MKQRSYNEKHWVRFKNGNLKGLYIYTTDEYSENYKDGNTDEEMMTSIASSGAIGTTIFDVGAFIGTSSLVYAKLVGDTGMVVAFEPNPYNLHRIEMNLQKNPVYNKRIIVCPFALSDNNNTTKMLLSEEIDNGHSSTSRINGAHSTLSNENLPNGFVELEIDNRRLDDYVNKSRIIPDIIKIDIEGAEHMMLAGSVNTLKRYHPDLYVEIHSEYCAIKCYEILNRHGYLIEIIKEEEDNRIMVKATSKKKSKKYLPIYLLLDSIKNDTFIGVLKKILKKIFHNKYKRHFE